MKRFTFFQQLVSFYFQFGNLLGCVVGLKASVAGITIVALGTSLPDTFASRTAALHDDGADAAIGNVTGMSLDSVYLTIMESQGSLACRLGANEI